MNYTGFKCAADSTISSTSRVQLLPEQPCRAPGGLLLLGPSATAAQPDGLLPPQASNSVRTRRQLLETYPDKFTVIAFPCDQVRCSRCPPPLRSSDACAGASPDLRIP